MDQEVLVEQKEQEGRRLIEALDAANLGPSAAFWFYQPDVSQWRLMVTGPGLDAGAKDPTEPYRKIANVLNNLVPTASALSISDLKVIGQRDPLLAVMGGIVRTGKGLTSIRMQNNAVNGIHIADALVYRMA
jgi:hypothetical protein